MSACRLLNDNNKIKNTMMISSILTATRRNFLSFATVAIVIAVLLCDDRIKAIHGGGPWTTSASHGARQPRRTRLATWKDRANIHANFRITDEYSNLIERIRRGGSIDASSSSPTTTTNDDERYSRQVYTLGKQAHGLIRTATVYIDGPPQSGLVYECAKNLALSGVRHIILVSTTTTNVEAEDRYHNAAWDDLGRTYQRGAKIELYGDSNIDVSDDTLLIEYTKRLNPSVIVTQMERSTLGDTATTTTIADDDDDDDTSTTTTTSPTVLLCIDRPISTAESLNHVARKNRWSFVATETAGVFGKVFCDFGTEFVVEDPDGETPVHTPLDHIDVGNIMDQGNIVVNCVDGERHDVSKGDRLQFQYRNGEKSSMSCTVVNVQTPFRFTAQLEPEDQSESLDSLIAKINNDASSFSRLKSTIVLTFDSIDSVTKIAFREESIFTACDLDKSYDIARRWASLSCFLALSDFIIAEKRLPSEPDKDSFVAFTKKYWPSNDFSGDATKHCESFLRTCAAKFSPLQSVFGAISAQEVLKAITRLYYPVHQLLLYDCDEILNDCHDDRSTIELPQLDLEKESPGLRYILGDNTVDQLQATKVFVVGSGAIGCEILKNLASMGVGTLGEGKVVITDMDTIEKSNLSRQLLFRDGDIGKFKSAAAREAVLRYSPRMQIEAHSCKVGDIGNDNPFDELFWSKGIDAVLNALDNVEARLFMDKQCVTNKKALIDAGTMGPKGNVQVIVPHQSESYASSADPPEPSIPLCTVKHFPYSIAHTIQWGRDLFEGLFLRRPQQANDFLESLQNEPSIDIAAKFVDDKGVEIAKELQEDLSMDISNDADNLQSLRSKALMWAIDLAFRFYHIEPNALLKKHPLDSLDDEGLPFWSGSRRPPRSLSFNPSSVEADTSAINENFIEFVRNGAKLRMESLIYKLQDGGDIEFSAVEVREGCAAYFKDGKKFQAENRDNEGEFERDLSLAKEALQSIVPMERSMKAIEFEKDDEENGHVAFVNAASNLRALVYGIPIVDAMETRRVAGKIVPAMISTTAFVSALSCTEFVKVVQNVDLHRHRNAFINLALPFFAFTVPLPAEKLPGLNGHDYTIWDQLSITESKKSAAAGGVTIKSLLKQIRKVASKNPTSVTVVSISAGPYMLYANFLHDEDESVLLSSLWEQVKDAISSSDTFDEENSRDTNDHKIDVFPNDSYIDLTVVVEDIETGDEVELPSLRVHRFQQ